MTTDQAGPPAAPEAAPELSAKTARNSILSFANFAVPTVLTVVVTPVLVHYLGADRYGIFVLSGVVLSFVALLDLGVQPAILKFVSEYAARGAQADINALIGVALLFYIVVGCIATVISTTIALFFLGDLFNLSAADRPLAELTLILAAVAYLISVQLAVLAAVPPALQRFGLSTGISLALQTPVALATVAVAALGFGLKGIMAVAVVGPIIGIAVVATIDRRLLPGFRPIPRWNGPLLRRLFSFSGFTFIANVASVLLFQLDKLLLGALGSVSLVTYYTIPGGLAQRVHAAASSLSVVALPVSSDLMARGERERVRQLYQRATRFILVFITAASVPLFVFASKILLYWLDATFAAKSTTVLRLLVLTYAMLALTAIPYFVSLGSHKPWVPAVYSVATAALNVSLIVVLIPRFQITGAAAGYLASTAFVPLLILYVERRMLELSGNFWARQLVRLALPAAAEVGLCLLLLPLVTNAVVLVVVLGLTFAAFPALCYVTRFLDAADRALLKGLVTRRSPVPAAMHE